MTRVFSERNPCGWVPVVIVRAVERGKRRGWLIVKPVVRTSTIDGKRKREHTVHPDRVEE